MTDQTISREWLCRNDEDYTDSLCLLLPDSQATLIDIALFEYLIRFDWQVLGRTVFYVERRLVSYVFRRCGTGRTGYGKYRIPPKTTMHSFTRTIFEKGFPNDTERWRAQRQMRGKEIDHKNRNPWDNRWTNLRIATGSQNRQNTGPHKDKVGKYKGVYKVKGKNKWTVRIVLQGKRHHLGTFNDEFKAAQAYNAFVRKHCPEFGYINPLSIDGEGEILMA